MLATYLGLSSGSLPVFSLSHASCYTFASLAVAPALLSLPSSSLARKYLYPAPLLLLAGAFFAPKPSALEDVNEQYQFGLLLGLWTFRLLDRLYLNEAEPTFKLKEDVKTDPDHYSPVKKLAWALELVTVSRGVGWNWGVEVPSTASKSYRDKISFLQMRIKKILYIYLGLSATALASGFVLRHQNQFPPGNLISSTALRLLMWWGYFANVYSSKTLSEDFLSVIFVGLGIGGRWSEPASWPPTFGNAAEAYSFRRFWGKWWHQRWRRMLTSPGKALIDVVPSLKSPKSKTSRMVRRYTQLLCTFVVSALIHSCGTYYVSSKNGNPPSSGGAFLFYGIQAGILLLEDTICHALGVEDDDNPTFLRRVVGYGALALFGMYAVPKKLCSGGASLGIEASGSAMMLGVRNLEMRTLSVLRSPFPNMWLAKLLFN